MNLKNFPTKLDSKTSCLRISVPENLDLALEGLIRKVLREQPKTDDIYSFAANYFEALLKVRDNAGVNLGTDQLCPFHNDQDAQEMFKLASSFPKVRTKSRASQKTPKIEKVKSKTKILDNKKKVIKEIESLKIQPTPDLIKKLPVIRPGTQERQPEPEKTGEKEEEEEFLTSDPIKELVEKELKEKGEHKTESNKEEVKPKAIAETENEKPAEVTDNIDTVIDKTNVPEKKIETKESIGKENDEEDVENKNENDANKPEEKGIEVGEMEVDKLKAKAVEETGSEITEKPTLDEEASKELKEEDTNITEEAKETELPAIKEETKPFEAAVEESREKESAPEEKETPKPEEGVTEEIKEKEATSENTAEKEETQTAETTEGTKEEKGTGKETAEAHEEMSKEAKQEEAISENEETPKPQEGVTEQANEKESPEIKEESKQHEVVAKEIKEDPKIHEEVVQEVQEKESKPEVEEESKVIQEVAQETKEKESTPEIKEESKHHKVVAKELKDESTSKKQESSKAQEEVTEEAKEKEVTQEIKEESKVLEEVAQEVQEKESKPEVKEEPKVHEEVAQETREKKSTPEIEKELKAHEAVVEEGKEKEATPKIGERLKPEEVTAEEAKEEAPPKTEETNTSQGIGEEVMEEKTAPKNEDAYIPQEKVTEEVKDKTISETREAPKIDVGAAVEPKETEVTKVEDFKLSELTAETIEEVEVKKEETKPKKEETEGVIETTPENKNDTPNQTDKIEKEISSITNAEITPVDGKLQTETSQEKPSAERKPVKLSQEENIDILEGKNEGKLPVENKQSEKNETAGILSELPSAQEITSGDKSNPPEVSHTDENKLEPLNNIEKAGKTENSADLETKNDKKELKANKVTDEPVERAEPAKDKEKTVLESITEEELQKEEGENVILGKEPEKMENAKQTEVAVLLGEEEKSKPIEETKKGDETAVEESKIGETKPETFENEVKNEKAVGREDRTEKLSLKPIEEGVESTTETKTDEDKMGTISSVAPEKELTEPEIKGTEKDATNENEGSPIKTKEDSSTPEKPIEDSTEYREHTEITPQIHLDDIKLDENEEKSKLQEVDENKTEAPTEDELCTVVDSLELKRVMESEKSGEADEKDSQDGKPIKTIETHYYDLLKVPETVTKEYKMRHTPEIAATTAGVTGALIKSYQLVREDKEDPVVVPEDVAVLNDLLSIGKIEQPESEIQNEEFQDLMTPSSSYSLNLSEMSIQTVSEMFLESEKQFSSLEKEEPRFTTPKTDEKQEESDSKKEVEEIIHKTIIPYAIEAVPVQPRDIEEINAETHPPVLEEDKKDPDKPEESSSDDSNNQNDTSQSNSKSIDSDTPIISVEVKTVIETQVLDDEDEEVDLKKLECVAELNNAPADVEVTVSATIDLPEDAALETPNLEDKKDDEKENQQKPEEVKSASNDDKTKGISSTEQTIGREGSSGESDTTASSTATEIKRSDSAKRNFANSRSILSTQSLEFEKRSTLQKTRSLSTLKHGVTDFDVWNTIEKELEQAATKIQSKYRGYTTRKKLRREDAVQITTEESSSSTPTEQDIKEECQRSTGEFHDSIILSHHPR